MKATSFTTTIPYDSSLSNVNKDVQRFDAASLHQQTGFETNPIKIVTRFTSLNFVTNLTLNISHHSEIKLLRELLQKLYHSMIILGWKLSPFVFYYWLQPQNVTRLSFQPNSFAVCWARFVKWREIKIEFYHKLSTFFLLIYFCLELVKSPTLFWDFYDLWSMLRMYW